MPIECVCRVAIKASPAACFTVLADPAGWHEWARDLDRVDVLDVGRAGRAARVRAEVTILGVAQHAVLEVLGEPEAHALRFKSVESVDAATIAGLVRFLPSGAITTMDVDVRITLVRPPGARVERMVSRKIETALTRDLVRHIERLERSDRS